MMTPAVSRRRFLGSTLAATAGGLMLGFGLASFTEQGRQLFGQRLGQLNLSCSNCHDRNAGQRLGGSPIPEGHATGYPVYRLEWQAVGSLQRRLRSCMAGVRAEAYAFGAPQWVALELFLAQRARGMPLETPAVRP